MRPKPKLPRSQFGAVRRCARSCYLQSGGNLDAASDLVRERMRSVVGAAFLSIAIQLAIKLIIWWIENGVSDPSVVSQVGEPGSMDEDLDEWDDA
jgi:hypothetical protein